MYSRELASAKQVEPVNQALGTVIFSGVYHKGACPLPYKDVNSLTGIDSDSRMSPRDVNSPGNRFWLEGGAPQDVNSLTGIDSGSRRSPQISNRDAWRAGCGGTLLLLAVFGVDVNQLQINNNNKENRNRDICFLIVSVSYFAPVTLTTYATALRRHDVSKNKGFKLYRSDDCKAGEYEPVLTQRALTDIKFIGLVMMTVHVVCIHVYACMMLRGIRRYLRNTPRTRRALNSPPAGAAAFAYPPYKTRHRLLHHDRRVRLGGSSARGPGNKAIYGQWTPPEPTAPASAQRGFKTTSGISSLTCPPRGGASAPAALASKVSSCRGEAAGSGVAAGSHFESVTLGNVTMSHRERGPPNALRLSHSTMIGLPRAALEN
ncbi:hypothetical protein EVAR_36798_1 [Eumeta japonica]|uniref:Uncharacterized protein n=1 Tax=Eumeta variegata TaxID=151549 RepID=A0A4C1WYT6_EUMVA|nr:hypothetical protein EVAR_36798_1 [Eumeta japonica]